MKYVDPEIEVIMLKTYDVVTLSNGGSTTGEDNVTGAPDGF